MGSTQLLKGMIVRDLAQNPAGDKAEARRHRVNLYLLVLDTVIAAKFARFDWGVQRLG